MTTFEEAKRQAEAAKKKREGVASEMTLRDYFAAKAMEGALAGIATRAELVIYTDLAGLSYEVADAMLKARAADGTR